MRILNESSKMGYKHIVFTLVESSRPNFLGMILLEWGMKMGVQVQADKSGLALIKA